MNVVSDVGAVVLLQRAGRDTPILSAALLCGPDIFFFCAAMKPFDVAVTFRMLICHPRMDDVEPAQDPNEDRRSEL